MQARITLKEAERFHGHLGPYLILGILAGETALKKLRCKKYYGLEVTVWGASKKPKSCLIDGLQLSSGATYGKGNIRKLNGELIKVQFLDKASQKRILFSLRGSITKLLKRTKTHKDSEALAKQLFRADSSKVFNLRLTD